jgi:predicted extracellular nuclease
MKSLRLACALLAVATASAACRDSGNGGDIDAGNGGIDGGDDSITIYDIKTPGSTILAGTPIDLRGVVVTAVDAHGRRTGNVYVQDVGGGAYSGISIFGGTGVDAIAPGDIVDITGGVLDLFAGIPGDFEFDEGFTLAQIKPPAGGEVVITKTSTGTVPTPELLAIDTFADPVEAEKWEGVLVEVRNVAVTVEPDQVSSTDTTLFEMEVSGPTVVSSALTSLDGITSGTCYSSLVGIGDYFFDYKVLPRGAGDLVTGGSACPPTTEADCTDEMDNDFDGHADCEDFDCAAESTCFTDATITQIQEDSIATIPTFTDKLVNIADAVVTLKTSSRIYVQEPGSSAAFSGISVYTDGPPPSLAPGDKVTVRGRVREYFTKTEVNLATVTDTATDVAVPTPHPLVVTEINTPATLESYEGVLVTIANAKALGTEAVGTSGNDWRVELKDGATTVVLRFSTLTQQALTMDTCYLSLTGVLDYSFDQWRVIPRTSADIQTGGTCN